MASPADHKGFAVSCGHEICPRWPGSRSSEVGELGDVVDIHRVDPPARLAPSGEKPGNQLFALGVDRGPADGR
jgi:hypothetical protein